MSDRICSFPGCALGVYSPKYGLCSGHYQQARAGKTLRPLYFPAPMPDRFWEKVDRSGGVEACWPWLNPLGQFGYGTFTIGGRNVRAHRMAWELTKGPIPAGLFIDHLCHNASTTCAGGVTCPHRACVNPAHLDVATPRENSVRSALTEAGKHARKTHCINGHEFTPENTYAGPNGSRRCARCCSERTKRYAAAKKST